MAIINKPYSPEGRESYDRIFGRAKKAESESFYIGRCKKCDVSGLHVSAKTGLCANCRMENTNED